MDQIDINVVLTLATIAISVVVFLSDRMQTRGQVRPHLNIFCGSHRDQVYVRLANCGMGPGVVKAIKIVYKGEKGEPEKTIVNVTTESIGTGITPSSLAQYVYDELQNTEFASDHLKFSDFVPFDALLGRAIPVDGSLMFLKIHSENYALCDAVRDILSHLTISVEYRDTFNGPIDSPCVRDCGWLAGTNSTNNGPVLVVEE